MATVTPQLARRGWFERHWKLVVSLVVLTTVLGASLFILSIFYLIRSSDSASLAISTAESNKLLAGRLGLPLKVGFFVTGNVEVNPGSGHAELAIPISGPKGSGTVYAEAHKSAGVWHLDLLQFADKANDNRVDLLPSNPDEQRDSAP